MRTQVAGCEIIPVRIGRHLRFKVCRELGAPLLLRWHGRLLLRWHEHLQPDGIWDRRPAYFKTRSKALEALALSVLVGIPETN